MLTENKIKIVGKFIGPRKIVEIKLADRKTYLGNDVVEIKFDDGTKREYPEESLKTIVTKEKGHLTALRELAVKPVADKIMAILVESELPINNPVEANIYYLINQVIPDHLKEKDREVYVKMFNKGYYDINLYDWNQMLQKKDGKQKE